MRLDLATARQIIAGAQAHGAQAGLKPLTVVVLDAGANVIVAERQDGSSNKRFEIAFGKANGALALGMGSRALMARAEQQAYFISAAAGAIGGALVPVPGGVLLRDRVGAGAAGESGAGAAGGEGPGPIIGAVGISGDSSDNDEAAAVAGARAAGLEAQVD
ncbi:MAG TPA: heme-binding protein [Solirubrobacteraceae bacterium]|nr:heme-binding protein [Solirubrobacteraceae bacterium]